VQQRLDEQGLRFAKHRDHADRLASVGRMPKHRLDRVDDPSRLGPVGVAFADTIDATGHARRLDVGRVRLAQGTDLPSYESWLLKAMISGTQRKCSTSRIASPNDCRPMS
jgi:hypothetical protein